MQLGTQIIYVPSHAKGDKTHSDCEPGFITSVCGDNAFCRYWRKTPPYELRTRSCSELTPIANLVVEDTVAQVVVDQAIQAWVYAR